jgi:PEGA domain
VVFVGGYFYDPFYGPFPWWSPAAYPGRFPIGDGRAHVRVQVASKNAAVYVDGFYAGIVDDFDGFFQPLPVLPGGHVVALYLEGYETVSRSIYLPPGSTFQLREELSVTAVRDGQRVPRRGTASSGTADWQLPSTANATS